MDIDEEEQISRLINSGRTDEIVKLSREEARASLNERWNLENERYMMIYGINNCNPKSYDLVLNTTNLTIEETGEKIMSAYREYVEKQK